MKTIHILLIFLLLLTGKSANCQDFEVPSPYSLKAAADYAPFEKDIIGAAKWLKATPFNEQVEKRKRVSAFVVRWIEGSPTVNVEINATIVEFEKKNPGMLVLYMAACAKYVLENNYSKDMQAKHKSALRDMIDVYIVGKSIVKDKKMEKLIKSNEQGKLDQWLAVNMDMGDGLKQ